VTDDRGLARLNALPQAAAIAELLQCCGSLAWARAMAAARPFASRAALYDTADAVWRGLSRDDWLEAFGAHPRIGERAAGGERDRHAQWSAQEQAGTRLADAETLAELAALNREYERRFGHVFLIRATGRSAAEMLAALRERLGHDAGEELRIAAEEQRRITRLRLEKLP
jgi:OHCU decarboxylase